MKKNKILLFAALTVFGAIAFCLGSFVLTQQNQKSISGMCIGLGAAAFCLGIGNCISAFLLSKTENEETIHRKNIDVNDERNIRIREKVGATINRIVLYALSFIVLALGFMGADLIIILMLVCVMVLELVLAIVLTNYYSKQM